MSLLQAKIQAKQRVIFLYSSLAIPLMLLTSCYTPVIEGAQQGYDASRRAELKNEKLSSPEKQYELGNTYCCQGGGPLNDLSIYNNSKATYWYCKAARRGYGPAQLQLANLYSGHAIRGLHVILRASSAIGNADTNLSLALMWAKLASSNTHDVDLSDATELRDEISQKASEQELAKTEALLSNWKKAPCEWSDIFPKHTK